MKMLLLLEVKNEEDARKLLEKLSEIEELVAVHIAEVEKILPTKNLWLMKRVFP